MKKRKENDENLDRRFSERPQAGDMSGSDGNRGVMGMSLDGEASGIGGSDGKGIMGMAESQMGSFMDEKKHDVKDPFSFGIAVWRFVY